MQKLEKLFLSNNKISIIENIKEIKHLKLLTELNLDGNAVCKIKIEYLKTIINSNSNL